MTVFLRATDSSGGTLDLIDYEDMRVPSQMFKNDFTEKLSIMKSLQHKTGDVMICSYPKTGTHWTANLIYFISRPESIDLEVSIQPVGMEISPIPDVASLTSPRVMATHLYYDRLPREFLKSGGKIIFLVRNPKDVVVSFFHMLRKLQGVNMDTNITWDACVTCFLNGLLQYKSYFDYLDDWQIVIQERPDQILVVYYEDLKKKCLSEVKRIQDYLGYANNDDRLQHIVDKCSIGSLKSDVETGKLKTKYITDDGQSVLYRKGEIGDWRNHLTVAQNEQFDTVIVKRLKSSMFKFQYE